MCNVSIIYVQLEQTMIDPCIDFSALTHVDPKNMACLRWCAQWPV